MLTEAAYEQKLKVYWFARGGSYYVKFKPELDARPLDKLLFLGAALGTDLLIEEMYKPS
jgi:hypothetical protein